MLRHLKNINELVLYSGVSCGLAFATRLVPGLWFPVLLLRLAVLAYTLYIISKVEGHKEFGFVLGGAVFLGTVGGYWDLLEIYIRWNTAWLLSATVLILAVAVFAIIVLKQLGFWNNANPNQK